MHSVNRPGDELRTAFEEYQSGTFLKHGRINPGLKIGMIGDFQLK